MKYLYYTFLLILGIVFFPTNMHSRNYREKYSTVLQHYLQNKNDSLKYKAALFLIDNMNGHESPEGKQLEIFKTKIDKINTKKGIRELNEAWNLSGKEGRTIMVSDSAVVTPRLLVANIDAAYDSWVSAPWKDEVDFSTFCNYILPYRCSKEHIGGNWRQAMKEKYSHVINDETDMLKAFAKIKKAVYDDVILSNAYCPYELDVITTHRIGKAECGQRAIVLVGVLRSLGIPAAIDFTPVWADYSNKSHGWVSVIDKKGITYTVFENDSIAKTLNPIDASLFIPRYIVKEEDHCPYIIKQSKTPVKVYREEFAIANPLTEVNEGFFNSPFLHDVSDKYGLTCRLSIDANTDKKVFLCTYVSASDWMPIAQTKPIRGKAVFENIGRNSLCTAYIEENGKRIYISYPFIVGDDGIEKMFSANKENMMVININRKYPLCQYIADVWGYMRGGVFLGANDSCFVKSDTLATIKTMPYGFTNIKSMSNKKYRFLRYKAPRNNRSSLSELQFWVYSKDDSKTKLHGTYSANGVETRNLEYLIDDNTATSCRGQNLEYTITVDLGIGNSSNVDGITCAPSTDLNFVEKGHLYELYYFDTSWKLIGKQIATKDFLIFKEVPEDAILLLKDRTAGQEERLFEYRNGVQIWH